MSEQPENGPGSASVFSVAQDQRVAITVTAGIAGILLYIVGASLAVWSYAVGGFDLNDWKFWIGWGGQLVSLFLFGWLLQWNKELQQLNPAVRRTLYGYNVFLGTVFLAAILIVVNILAAQYPQTFGLKASYDWTSQGVFTL